MVICNGDRPALDSLNSKLCDQKNYHARTSMGYTLNSKKRLPYNVIRTIFGV